jgi:hypothetical protein
VNENLRVVQQLITQKPTTKMAFFAHQFFRRQPTKSMKKI